MNEEYGPEDFRRDTNVSRETLAKLVLYAQLLAKWNKTVNLVSNASLKSLWKRHFLDCAQLAPLIEQHARAHPVCLDIGAGAGFPGMVLAIMQTGEWTLVESDQRKIAFLSELCRVCEVSVKLRAERIETMHPFSADVITARAVAPLGQLMKYGKPFVNEDTVCLFSKGRLHGAEVTEAQGDWAFEHKLFPSKSDPDGRVVMIEGVFDER